MQAAAITGNGFNICYDPARPENAYLGNQTYAFANGGALVPVPEPSAALLVVMGAAALASRRRAAR